jgi:hypothetical protein
VPKVREVAKDPRSTAKPQRAVISNVAKLSQDKGDEGKLLRDDKQQFILRLKLLTNQNNILRSNSIKVCIRSK